MVDNKYALHGRKELLMVYEPKRVASSPKVVNKRLSHKQTEKYSGGIMCITISRSFPGVAKLRFPRHPRRKQPIVPHSCIYQKKTGQLEMKGRNF